MNKVEALTALLEEAARVFGLGPVREMKGSGALLNIKEFVDHSQNKPLRGDPQYEITIDNDHIHILECNGVPQEGIMGFSLRSTREFVDFFVLHRIETLHMWDVSRYWCPKNDFKYIYRFDHDKFETNVDFYLTKIQGFLDSEYAINLCKIIGMPDDDYDFPYDGKYSNKIVRKNECYTRVSRFWAIFHPFQRFPGRR